MPKKNEWETRDRWKLSNSEVLADLVSKAVAASRDPEITGLTRGWFPRLIRESLRAYIASQQVAK